MKFKVGDRVAYVNPVAKETRSSYITEGCVGTVRDTTSFHGTIGVEWDDDIEGHSFISGCREGHCWFVNVEDVSKIDRDLLTFKIVTDGKNTTAYLLRSTDDKEELISIDKEGLKNIDLCVQKAIAKLGSPKPFPKELLCVKDYSDVLKKGKMYEFDGHKVNNDLLKCFEFYSEDFEEWKTKDPEFASCLVPVVSRHAELNEWVYVHNASLWEDNKYKNGDILQVKYSSEYNSMYVQTVPEDIWTAMDDSEYLVLEGYDPKIHGN